MRMLITLAMLALALPAVAQPQSWAWQGPGYEAVRALATNGSGTIALALNVGVTTNLDPQGQGQPSLGNSGDVAVAVLEPTGATRWARRFAVTGPARPTAIGLDPLGHVLVALHFADSFDVSTTPNLANWRIAQSGLDGLVLRLHALTGELLWAAQLVGTGNVKPLALGLPNSLQVLVGGAFTDSMDVDPHPVNTAWRQSQGFSDAFVLKLNLTTGNLVQDRLYGSPADDLPGNAGMGIAFDPSGQTNDWFLGLSIGDAVDMDAATGPGRYFPVVPNLAGVDVVVARLSATDSVIWATRFGGNGLDLLHGLAPAPNNQVVAVGQFEDTANTSPVLGTTVQAGPHPSGYVLKLRTGNGTPIFTRALAGNAPAALHHVLPEANGGLFALGLLEGTADLDDAPTRVFPISARSSGGAANMCLLRYGPAGNPLWGEVFGGPVVGALRTAQVGGLAAWPPNQVLVGAAFWDTVDLDPTPSTLLLRGQGEADAVLWRVDTAGAQAGTPINPNAPRVDRVIFYPDSLAAAGGPTLLSCRVYDQDGDTDLVSVKANLTDLGLEASRPLNDLGQDGDLYIGDGIWSTAINLPAQSQAEGPRVVQIVARDQAGLVGTATGTLRVGPVSRHQPLGQPGLRLWPNPTQGVFWAENLPAGQLHLTDALGRTVAQWPAPQGLGPHRFGLPAGLPPGLYTLRGGQGLAAPLWLQAR